MQHVGSVFYTYIKMQGCSLGDYKWKSFVIYDKLFLKETKIDAVVVIFLADMLLFFSTLIERKKFPSVLLGYFAQNISQPESKRIKSISMQLKLIFELLMFIFIIEWIFKANQFFIYCLLIFIDVVFSE